MTELHATTGGATVSGSPVILLHGFGACADVWESVAAKLAGTHASLAYDLPGHHRSMLADGVGGAGRMAKAILTDLQARGLDRFHLVGHSMGGAVAALVALRVPESTASLTLLAPGGFGPEINHRLLARYASATTREEMRLALEHMFGWNNVVPDRMIDTLVGLRQAEGAAEALRSILPSMTSEDGSGGKVQGMLPRDGLATLTMPVKVLWGTQDRVLPTRQAHKLPPLFAAHVFEDTGHMLIEEQPDAVATLIAQNLAAAR
ncbi:alpha/beta fold hydrolase [Pararhizobium haloflavum]|uniref:alpha/beta fold hydrolase n=1 Tax=Pararhizobium haloflavum TaxID=2037914 RepID=UPI000C19E4A4|nr:alpha/beta fold hydrolase [Pararhizobium haloflavum]